MAAEIFAHSRRLRALRDGSARRGALVVPHAGRRSISLLDWAVELLLLGADLYSQFRAAPWRQGAEAVHRWREANGGLLHTSIRATGWMFGALFFSYVAEFLMIFLRPSLAVRQNAAPGLHLQPFGVRLDMEARPWVRSSNSASPGG